MTKYVRIALHIVEAEEMNEFDFNLKAPGSRSLAGVTEGRPSGHRTGYKVVDEEGAVIWMEKEKFEREYKKI
jgi:hypothetical protein